MTLLEELFKKGRVRIFPHGRSSAEELVAKGFARWGDAAPTLAGSTYGEWLLPVEGRAEAAAVSGSMENRVERNHHGRVVEVVANGGTHLELMSGTPTRGRWFLNCIRADGSSIALWIYGEITMDEERPGTGN